MVRIVWWNTHQEASSSWTGAALATLLIVAVGALVWMWYTSGNNANGDIVESEYETRVVYSEGASEEAARRAYGGRSERHA